MEYRGPYVIGFAPLNPSYDLGYDLGDDSSFKAGRGRAAPSRGAAACRRARPRSSMRNCAGSVLLLDEAARLGRRVHKQDAAGLGAGALPGMRDIARHEGATARAADRDLVADQERDLTLQDVGNFVAVVVQVERAFRAGWHGFFEHHHAVGSVGAAQFRHDRATPRKALHRAFAGLHDDALCGHGSLLSRVPQSGEGPTISHW